MNPSGQWGLPEGRLKLHIPPPLGMGQEGRSQEPGAGKAASTQLGSPCT